MVYRGTETVSCEQEGICVDWSDTTSESGDWGIACELGVICETGSPALHEHEDFKYSGCCKDVCDSTCNINQMTGMKMVETF